jgi:two-component system, sporulation sensor kinase E
VVFEDLTEQQLLEEQLRRADRLRSLGELSAAIAHEVRNPLQGISLTLSNLKNHLAEGGERYVEVMFQEMERLDSIVGSILSFARPAPPQPQWVSLREVCARACELASERAAQARVQLCLEGGSEDVPCEVDERQILQVVLNVLMNAIDVSPAGESVSLRLLVPETPLLRQGPVPSPAVCRIEIRDRGPGIPMDLREKLFDPFFTTKAEGNGLGLAVSQKIVEEHHGVIHVDCEASGGTCFVIELPRRFFGAFEMSSPTNTYEEDSNGCA